jgi:putative FmdB family regulatory protein
MVIYSYRCEVCGKVQEKWHKMADKNTEPCENEKCLAPPEKLTKQLSPVYGHVK